MSARTAKGFCESLHGSPELQIPLVLWHVITRNKKVIKVCKTQIFTRLQLTFWPEKKCSGQKDVSVASAIGILSGAFPEASLRKTAVIPPLQFIVN